MHAREHVCLLHHLRDGHLAQLPRRDDELHEVSLASLHRDVRVATHVRHPEQRHHVRICARLQRVYLELDRRALLGSLGGPDGRLLQAQAPSQIKIAMSFAAPQARCAAPHRENDLQRNQPPCVALHAAAHGAACAGACMCW
jgi:hypothetical protein